jgi:hypothetical protein
MAVLCEAISVIVRRESIDAFYEGGWNVFLANVPNSTMCTDGELVRVGFMAPNEVKAFVEGLESKGLVFQQPPKKFGLFKATRHLSDIAVVDARQGLTMPCEWVDFKRVSFGDTGVKVSACWLAKGNAGETTLATPTGWQYENSLSYSHYEDSDIGTRVVFLRNENGLDVYKDLVTGKELYKPEDKPPTTH